MNNNLFSKLNKFSRRIIPVALGFCMALADPMTVLAEYNEAETVSLPDSDIPESTMIVGTHLISVEAMDNYLYNIASLSANESGQNVIYYKSELANGKWYDISSATTLDDISTGGSVVDTDTIESLKFTHQTLEDGITYDLYNMQPVCIYDIYDTYDMEDIQDLYSIKYRLKSLRSKKNKTDSDVYTIEQVTDFYDEDLHTSQTDNYDQQMSALEAYYEILCNEGTTADRRETLHSVMEKLDAKRRANVYKTLYNSLLPNLLKKVQGMTKDCDVENFVPDADLVSIIQDAITSVNSSYESYSNSMLTKGTTSISSLEYSYVQQLYRSAADGDRDKADTYLDRLTSLYHIQDGKVVSSDEELELIDDQLLSKVNSAYLTELGKGAGNDYQTSVDNNESASAQEKALANRADELEEALSELEFVIQAREERLTNIKAQAFIKKRIADISYFQKAIKDDVFQEKAKASTNEYLSFLTEELKKLVEDSTDGSKMGKLNDQKQKLTEERKQALDENNLGAEKELSLQIEEVQDRIDALSAELSDVINDPDSTNTEVAEAKANLGSGNSVSDVLALKDNACTYIDNRQYDAAGESIDGIITLMSECKNTSITALKDINADLLAAELTYPDDTGIETLLQQIQDGLGDNADLMLNALTKKALDQFLTDQYNQEFEDMDDKVQAEVLEAFNQYAESTGDSTVASYMSGLAETAYKSANNYVYVKMSGTKDVYVESRRLAKKLGYRYIYSNSYKNCGLKLEGRYYGFKAYQKDVTRENNGTDTLSKATQFLTTIYIPADYVETQFGITAEYLKDTDYGIMTTTDMEGDIDALVQSLTKVAEGL